MILKVKPDGRQLLNSLNNINEKDDNITAFETWGEFKTFCSKDGQTVDDLCVMKSAKLK